MTRETLAKLLFCDIDDLGNVLLHIPIGLIVVAIALFSPLVAVAFYYGFIKYETVQRRQIRDKCFPDIHGSLVGIILLAIPLAIAGVRTGI
jgi:hypothetical protein